MAGEEDGVAGADVTKNVNISIDDKTKYSNFYGLRESVAEGNLTLDIKGYAGEDSIYNTFYGVYDQRKQAEYSVGGDMTINVSGGFINSFNGGRRKKRTRLRKKLNYR